MNMAVEDRQVQIGEGTPSWYYLCGYSFKRYYSTIQVGEGTPPWYTLPYVIVNLEYVIA